MNTRDRLERIVREHLGVEPERAIDDASTLEELGADSLDSIELVMAAEEEFRIEIPDGVADKFRTFGDALEAVARIIKESSK